MKLFRGEISAAIVTLEAAQALFSNTHILGLRCFTSSMYGMGLRLSEGLNLKLADCEAVRHRVHIRDSKSDGNRFAPLPEVTPIFGNRLNFECLTVNG